MSNYKCYQQGYSDVCVRLRDTVPSSMLVFDPVDEESDQWDSVSYLQGQVAALVEHIAREDKANRRSANVASCLANGIIPD